MQASLEMCDGCGRQHEFFRAGDVARSSGVLAGAGEEFGFHPVQRRIQVVDDVQSAELRLQWGVLADQQVDVLGGDEDDRGWPWAVSLGEQCDDQGTEGIEGSGADQPEAAGACQIEGAGLAVFGGDNPFCPRRSSQDGVFA
ncbi:hypothetical protein [Streptomyces sp. Rer75]|uniref:hypothetical protein n=1 Tax=Streptomyces sp. Rer75 TaxID=2750011 RepID=UPI0015D0A629|nr:hypothetical protein [Streptomyces sp. Rer75]QLH21826.1 hypothetical protein HYQ63_15370 [Streptomyces sp. Rer75]